MIGRFNVSDLGYNGFNIRTIPVSNTLSPLEASNMIGVGSLSASSLSTPLNATTDIVFSSTDYNTAAWTAGTIYFADGTVTDSITAGNTGDITATTYVYYDKDVPLILSTTDSHARAVGANRLLIAIVELGEVGKDCKITPTIAAGLNVSGITADQIEAGTITADEVATGAIDTDQLAADAVTADKVAAGAIDTDQLAADAVTADKIDVSQLDAVAVNTGTLTVDEYINVGDSNIKIDGDNNRIVLYNSSVPEILIGEP